MPISINDCPYTGPYSIDGNGKHKGPTAEALKRAMKRAQFGFKNKELDELTQDFNKDLESALDKWDPGKDGYGDGRWKKIRNLRCPAESPHEGQWALDEYAQRLIRDESILAVVPNLGPVHSAGQSLLQQDLTHATSGIPLYPAFDDAFRTGCVIIAPEQITITKASSSNPGDACYAEGKSKLRYWFGHLAEAPAVGNEDRQGQADRRHLPQQHRRRPPCPRRRQRRGVLVEGQAAAAPHQLHPRRTDHRGAVGEGAMTTGEAVFWGTVGFFSLLAVMVFLRLMLRKGPPHWTQIRLGVYIERVPDDEWPPPSEQPTVVLPPKPDVG